MTKTLIVDSEKNVESQKGYFVHHSDSEDEQQPPADNMNFGAPDENVSEGEESNPKDTIQMIDSVKQRGRVETMMNKKNPNNLISVADSVYMAKGMTDSIGPSQEGGMSVADD